MHSRAFPSAKSIRSKAAVNAQASPSTMPLQGTSRRSTRSRHMYTYETEVIEREQDTVHMNVGPSHPAMHGTLRLKLEIRGETIVNCEQEIGFLHTGFEKLAEYRSFNQFVTVT